MLSRIGAMMEFSDIETFHSKLEIVLSHGFICCQIFARGMYPDTADFELIADKLDAAGIDISAIGLYCSLLRPDERVMGNTLEDAIRTIGVASDFGKYNYIVWSGTFADDLLQDHEENHSDKGWNKLTDNAFRIMEIVQRGGGNLLIEPYWAHTIRDTGTFIHLREQLGSENLKMVLDPPNVLSARLFAQRDEIIERECRAARSYTGIVHLKDIESDTPGQFGYPFSGRGKLNYPLFIRELIRNGYDMCAVIEHVNTPDEYSQAKNYIESIIKQSIE
jgi:sugar phosphate isomerase/epimerase